MYIGLSKQVTASFFCTTFCYLSYHIYLCSAKFSLSFPHSFSPYFAAFPAVWFYIVNFHMQITASSKNPRSSLHMDSEVHGAWLLSWLWCGTQAVFWQLNASPHLFSSSAPEGKTEKRKRGKESLKFCSLFLSEHISSRSCFCSTHAMEWARAVNTENREASLTDPVSTLQSHYSRRTCCSPSVSCVSLSWSPSYCIEPWRRPCLYLSYVLTRESCYSHSWG